MKRAKTLPPVPASVPSILGPVPVARVAELRDKRDRECYGIWRANERDVRLEASMADVTAWQTYWHEWTHIVLWDAGIKLRDADAERVCDAFATARVREMLDG